MLDKTELEDLLVDYLGRKHFTPHDRYLFCLVQTELDWAKCWEDWGRRQKVENLFREMENGMR